MKKLLLKKYVTLNYLKKYKKDFINNDLVLCNLFLKVTNNSLYDPTLNSIFENLQEKKFKWYLKHPNIIVYKKNILIEDYLFLLNIKNLYCISLKLNNNFYFNLSSSSFLITNNLSFFINIHRLFMNFFINLVLISKLKNKASA